LPTLHLRSQGQKNTKQDDVYLIWIIRAYRTQIMEQFATMPKKHQTNEQNVAQAACFWQKIENPATT
jgi:hypothetical protein